MNYIPDSNTFFCSLSGKYELHIKYEFYRSLIEVPTVPVSVPVPGFLSIRENKRFAFLDPGAPGKINPRGLHSPQKIVQIDFLV